MNKIKYNIINYLSPALRIIIGILFIISGILKLTNIESFRYTIFSLSFFNTSISNIIIYLIPVIEIILGAVFALGIFIRFTAIHLDVLVFLFMFVTFYALRNNLDLSCGCFGGLWDMKFTWYHMLVLFIVFTANIFILIDIKDIWSFEKFLKEKLTGKNRTKVFNILFISFSIIGILLIVLALLFNFSIIGKKLQSGTSQNPSVSGSFTEKESVIMTVTIDEAYQAFKSNKDYIFIDVRSADEYKNGHIKGALSIPLSELSERMQEIPADKPIIAYCSGSSCNLSGAAVKMLLKNGFTKVYDMAGGGINEWKLKGYPLED